MSLGPPFDDSGERLKLGIGAASGCVLIFVTAFALLAAERPLGESINVHVRVARPGALHTGAAVRVAGEQIGEVVAIRGQPAKVGKEDVPVDIEVRLRTQYRDRLYRNSSIVTVNPTLLTEALLEVGPPLHGLAPEGPIQDGDRLRGIDPADIDQFMRKLYDAMEIVLKESRDLEPEWNEFQSSFSGLSSRLQVTLPPEVLLRLGLHAASASASGSHLVDTLRAAGVDKAPAELRALLNTSEPLFKEVSRFAQKLELLQTRASDMNAAINSRQRDILRAFAGLRDAFSATDRIESDAKVLIENFNAGRGTLGGFNRDIQIFDELKEMHRILKRRTWRLLIKRPDAGQRNVR